MMSVSVMGRPLNHGTSERTDAGALAIAFFRSCLYDIALCQDDLDEEVLRQWERILRGEPVGDYSITRYFQAIVGAKRRLRNPVNTVAYLVYKMSHGGQPHTPDAPWWDAPVDQNARHCIACSAPINEERRRRMVERIQKGYRLQDVKTPLDFDEIVHTHLTQEEIFEFVGHEVSFSYQEKKIQEVYDELERQEAKSRI
jgi:hypothetical protein